MKMFFAFMLVLNPLLLNAQYTFVPDDGFEQLLIDYGHDDILDDYVLTSNINILTHLDISGESISDLTGIEDFTALAVLDCTFTSITTLNLSNNLALTKLVCYSNQLTNLDITKNIALTELYLEGNLLTDIDLSQNTALTMLRCSNNHLTNLDLSQNLNLKVLWCEGNQLTNLNIQNNSALEQITCYSNQLTSLDISQNPAIEFLQCNNNQLNSLNLKNGNYTILTYLYTKNNPELTCIQVDSTEWFNNRWSSHIDTWTNFSQECNWASTTDSQLMSISVFPNPVKKTLNFSEKLSDISIYNMKGKKVLLKKEAFSINVVLLPSGSYFLQAETIDGKTINKKFVKN